MTTHAIDRFQLARFLRMQPWFAQLTPGAQDELLRGAATLRARKGQTLLPAHEVAQGWYALMTGFVKLQSPLPGEQVSAFLALTGGEWFGEGSVMREEPRRYEVVALRDSELLCLPRAQFHQLLDSSLAFNRAVIGHLNQRLGQAMAVIEIQRGGTLEQRLALYLSRPFWHGLRRLNLSQEELGCLAGMSRQTANRALKGLEHRGLVALRHGRVAAVAQEALEQFVGLWPKADAAERVGLG